MLRSGTAFLPFHRITPAIFGVLAAVWLCLSAGAASGQTAPGVRDDVIRIGSSLALTGPNAMLGQEFRQGANEYLSLVNAQGGVHLRRIEIEWRDDRYEPAQTAMNIQHFIENKPVFSLFGLVGTPTVKAILPAIESAGVPLVAPMTGAKLLRLGSPVIFNMRASYHDEIETIIHYLVGYGRDEVAVVYQDDAYGLDGLVGAEQALHRRGLRPVALDTVQRNSDDTLKAAQTVAAAKPDAVIIISAYSTVASFVRNLRREGSEAQVMNVSFVGAKSLAEELGSDGHGVGISQVVPFPWDARVPVVQEYQRAIARNGGDRVYSFISLEGFIAARVLVAALQKAGRNLTREGLLRALEQMKGADIGGFHIAGSPGTLSTAGYTNLTFIMGGQGAFIH